MSKELQGNIVTSSLSLIFIILSIGFVIMYGQGYRFTKQKNYLYIDLGNITSRMKDDFKVTNISDRELSIALNEQKTRLYKKLKLLEEENIVFISHKPLSGAKDYTDEFYKKLTEQGAK